MAICTHAGGRDSSGSVNRNSKTLAKLERVEAAASLPPAVTCVRETQASEFTTAALLEPLGTSILLNMAHLAQSLNSLRLLVRLS